MVFFLESLSYVSGSAALKTCLELIFLQINNGSFFIISFLCQPFSLFMCVCCVLAISSAPFTEYCTTFIAHGGVSRIIKLTTSKETLPLRSLVCDILQSLINIGLFHHHFLLSSFGDRCVCLFPQQGTLMLFGSAPRALALQSNVSRTTRTMN